MLIFNIIQVNTTHGKKNICLWAKYDRVSQFVISDTEELSKIINTINLIDI